MEKNSDNSLFIRHECPQCGSPITLLEDDRMVSCAYCRVKLFLAGGDYFRYYLPPAPDIREEIRYVPYWRFKGLDYAVSPLDVSGKYVDQTVLAVGPRSFPITLGLRPQALTLRFVSPDVPGTFLPSDVSMDDAFALAEERSALFTGHEKPLRRAFIGRTASMIYAPVYEKDGILHDGVLKNPVQTQAPTVREQFNRPDARTDWRVEFLPTLCPECGWQLTGENGSAIFICGNCVSLWEMSGKSLKRTDFIVAPGGEKDGIFHIPFWRIAAVSKGIALDSYADFARAVNLPKVIKEEWEHQELFFWFPAFKAKPDLFLRLATLFTLAQPHIENSDKRVWAGRNSFAPITLAASEAANGLIASLAKMGTKKLHEELSGIDLTLKSATLVLLPFRQSNEEYVEINLNLSIPRVVFPSGSK